jgi:outer membrane protein W
MKKALTTASLLAFIALPVWAGGIGVMYSSWDTDDANDDQGVGIKIELDVGSALDFEVRAAWLDSHEFDTEIDAFKLEIAPVDIGLSYDFRTDEKVRPYLGGGLTYAFLNGKVADSSSIRVDDEVGFYVTGGLEGSVSETFALFAEALYRDLSAEFTSDGLLNRDFQDFGVDLAGVAFNVGLMFTW